MTMRLDWMPDVPMSRVIVHWTAGSNAANQVDLNAYHFVIEGDGRLRKGTASIAFNSRRLQRGYAAHTLRCNTGSVGVSMCGMAGACESPFHAGRYPITQAQWRALVVTVALLCRRYRISVGPRTVLSHAEVETNLGIRQRGKWDITRLPFDAGVVGARQCGDKLRRDVVGALNSGGDVPAVTRVDSAWDDTIALFREQAGDLVDTILTAIINAVLKSQR